MGASEDLVKVTLRADAKNLLQGLAQVSEAAQGMGRAWDFSMRQIGKSETALVSSAKTTRNWGLAVSATMAVNVKAAMDYETALNNVYTIMDRGSGAGKNLKKDLLDLSTQFPQSAKSLAEGAYDIASSGIEANQVVSVLAASTRAASAGMTESATAARAITGTLNAYAMSAQSASYVSDVLFKTVELGVITFEELSTQMGDWVGLAAQAGVGLEDASAALATITLNGLPAAEASTALARAISSFIKPSKAMEQEVQKLGYATPATMLKMLGLKGSVDALMQSTGGTPERLSEIFDEIRALNGVLALGAGNGEKYNETFDQMNDRAGVAGASQRAYEEQSKSLSQQIELLKNNFTALRIELGGYLIPVIKYTVGGMSNLLGTTKAIVSLIPRRLAVIASSIVGLAGVVMTAGGSFVAWKVKGMVMASVFGKLLPMIGVTGVATSSLTMNMVQVIARFTQSVPVIGKYSKVIATAGTATSGMITKLSKYAAVGATVVAATLWITSSIISGYQKADRAAKTFIETQDSLRTSPNDLDGMSAGIKNYGAELDRLSKKWNKQSLNPAEFVGMFAGDIKSISVGTRELWSVLSGDGLQIQQTKKQMDEINSAIDKLSKKEAAVTSNAFALSQKYGVSIEEIVQIADNAGISLAGTAVKYELSYDKAGNAVVSFRNENGKMVTTMDAAIEAQERGYTSTEDLSAGLRATAGELVNLKVKEAELTDVQKTLNESMSQITSGTKGFAEALAAKQKWVDTIRKQEEDEISRKEEVADAAESGADALYGLLDAQKAQADASRDLREAEQAALPTSREMRDATQAVADAQEELSKAQKAALPTSREMVDATLAVTNAQKELEDAQKDALPTSREMVDLDKNVASAEKDLKKAQEESLQAQEDLTKARKDAAETMLDLEEASKSSVLDERDAARNLRDAQAELANINVNPDPEDENWKPATADEMEEAIDRVARAELALEQAKRDAIEAQEAFNKSQADGVDGSETVVNALQRIEDANTGVADAQVTLNRAQEDRVLGHEAAALRITEAERTVSRAIEDRTLAQEAAAARVVEAERGVQRAVEDRIEAHETATKRVEEASQRVVDAGTNVEDALRKVQEASDKYHKLVTSAHEQTTKDVELSLQDYIDSMGGSNEAGEKWGKDLTVVAERMAAMFGVSGSDVVAYLSAMGSEGTELVHLMAIGTDKEVRDMAEAIRTNMKLNSDNMSKELEAGLLIASEKGRLGAKGVREAIIEQLQPLAGDIDRISKDWGISLQSGLQPVLDALGREYPGPGTVPNPGYWSTANSVQPNTSGGQGGGGGNNNTEPDKWPNFWMPWDFAFADGGQRLPSAARYQPAGPDKITWAEPETEGEWFIPAAKSKRGTSTSVLAAAARSFGYELTYAAGGFRSGADVPPIPKHSTGGALGSFADWTFGEVRRTVANTVDYIRSFGYADGGLHKPGASPTADVYFDKYKLDFNPEKTSSPEVPNWFDISKGKPGKPIGFSPQEDAPIDWAKGYRPSAGMEVLGLLSKNRAKYAEDFKFEKEKEFFGGIIWQLKKVKDDQVDYVKSGSGLGSGPTYSPITVQKNPGSGGNGPTGAYAQGVPWWVSGWNYQVSNQPGLTGNPWQRWRPGEKWNNKPTGETMDLWSSSYNPYSYGFMTAPPANDSKDKAEAAKATAATTASTTATATDPKVAAEKRPPNMTLEEFMSMTYGPPKGWWLAKKRNATEKDRYRAWSLRQDSAAYWADNKHSIKKYKDTDKESIKAAALLDKFFQKTNSTMGTISPTAKVPVFDSGGTLTPGYNTVYNATGAPEHLVPVSSGGGKVVEIDYQKLARIIQSSRPTEINVDARGVQNPYEMARRTSTLIGQEISSFGGV